MIGIVNYGMGNLASVQNALNYLNIPNEITSQATDLRKYDRIILPGVGAFGVAMQRIKEAGFLDEIREFAIARQKPLLGICLGMQLLLESSTEHGFFQGLGLAAGKVEFLGDAITNLPIPHIGWNSVFPKSGSVLLKDADVPEWTFYFVHSYYCSLTDRSLVTGKTSYCIDFDAVFEAGNIFGVQFHPEKSQKSGLSLLRNFGTV